MFLVVRLIWRCYPLAEHRQLDTTSQKSSDVGKDSGASLRGSRHIWC
jgi:hypothetical protein